MQLVHSVTTKHRFTSLHLIDHGTAVQAALGYAVDAPNNNNNVTPHKHGVIYALIESYQLFAVLLASERAHCPCEFH